MFWLRKLNKKSPPESQPTANMAEELDEARSIRERIRSQAPLVSSTFSMLADARQHEQFTDEIDASFTRRHR